MHPNGLTEEEIQLLKSLSFVESDVFNAVITIINNNIEFEVANATGVMNDETLRAHACGRVDGLRYIKEKLITYNETAREFKLAGRI